MSDALQAKGRPRTITKALLPLGSLTEENLSSTLESLGYDITTNSNGSYVVLPNGLQICWNSDIGVSSWTLSSYNIGTYGWSYYHGTKSVTYPKSFAAAPVTIVSPSTTDSSTARSAAASNITTTGFTLTLNSQQNTAGGYGSYIAIGAAS